MAAEQERAIPRVATHRSREVGAHIKTHARRRWRKNGVSRARAHDDARASTRARGHCRDHGAALDIGQPGRAHALTKPCAPPVRTSFGSLIGRSDRLVPTRARAFPHAAVLHARVPERVVACGRRLLALFARGRLGRGALRLGRRGRWRRLGLGRRWPRCGNASDDRRRATTMMVATTTATATSSAGLKSFPGTDRENFGAHDLGRA